MTMIRRLRLVLPPPAILLGFALLYTILEGLVLAVEWHLGAPVRRMAGRPGVVLPLLAAALYGGFRVIAFHPVYRPNYRVWLEATPWTSRKPLPVGPVSLVWEDGVVLSLLCLLHLVQPELEPMRLLGLFLLVHQGCFVPVLAMTGGWLSAYLVVFGLGLVVRLWPDPTLALAAAIVVTVVGHVGLLRSLARFPWPRFQQDPAAPGWGVSWTSREQLNCGWPFDQLKPKNITYMKLARRDGVLIGLLLGWWVFACQGLITDPQERAGFGLLAWFYAAGILLVGRIGHYLANYRPPLNLWGRIVTFRWIIPGYDVVWIGPLLMIILPLLIGIELKRADIPLEYAPPLCVAASALAALNVGPGLERWRLTGRHRIVPMSAADTIKGG